MEWCRSIQELVNEIDGCIKAGISSIPRRGAYSIFITTANGIENTSEFLTEYSQALYKHMLEKGLELKWKETGKQKTSFSICSGKHTEQDSESPYLPEKLAEGFNLNPWLARIFKAKP